MPRKNKNKLSNPIKICRICGNILNKDNFSEASKLSKHYECKKCQNEYMTKMRIKHHVKILERRRRTILCTTKKTYHNLNKRSYPIDESCELCGKNKGKLSYHHWDDSNPSMGIWVCWHCHGVCETHEKVDAQSVLDRYITFKKQMGYQ